MEREFPAKKNKTSKNSRDIAVGTITGENFINMGHTDLSLYNNDWYKREIGAGKIRQILWYFVNVLFFINPLNPSSALKCVMLKWFGSEIGHGVVIKPGVNIKYPWKLKIGDYTWIGEKAWIDNLGAVVIGKNVCISQGALLLTGNHNYKKASFDLMVKGINIEDGVWIGACSTVCPGVTMGSHTVLTVGSVATKNTRPFSIYRGNPACFVKERDMDHP